MIILWVALVVSAGVLSGALLSSLAIVSPFIGAVIGVAVAVTLFIASRQIVEQSFVLQIANCWPYVREFARGKPSGYSRSIALFAERISINVPSPEPRSRRSVVYCVSNVQ